MARRSAQMVAVQALGLTFPHPLGLAAGFDKNAVGIDALAALGFGHVEIGTVTGEPQPGNPKPRLFRLPADRAIVNRMGFNNDGAEVVARRWRPGRPPFAPTRAPSRRLGPDRSRRVVVGVNIGKSKVVPEDDQAAVQGDYEKSAGLLAPYADYLVVNVSSPNTPGLRVLQAVDRLGPLLEAVRRRADEVTDHRVPLLVKIAPDLADDDVLAVADLATGLGPRRAHRHQHHDQPRAGSSPTRPRSSGSAPADCPGGRSPRAPWRCCGCSRRVGDDLTLVSVGGITTRRRRPRATGRRRDPGPGLHRLRLRGPALAPARWCAGSR